MGFRFKATNWFQWHQTGWRCILILPTTRVSCVSLLILWKNRVRRLTFAPPPTMAGGNKEIQCIKYCHPSRQHPHDRCCHFWRALMQCGAASSDMAAVPGTADPICQDFIRKSIVLFWAPWQLFKKTTQSIPRPIFSRNICIFGPQGGKEAYCNLTHSNSSFVHPPLPPIIKNTLLCLCWPVILPHPTAWKRESGGWWRLARRYLEQQLFIPQ